MIPRLYLITDRKLFTNYSEYFNTIEKALRAGVRLIQLREKDLPTNQLLDIAYKLRDLTNKYNAKLLINDRVDIALCINADGIHLAQTSLPPSAAKKIVRSDMLIGFSTHSFEEAIFAQEDGADFITFGPIYETPSKLKYGSPVGLDAFREISKSITIPIFGIGGINYNNIKDVLYSGAYGVAMIRGILSEENIEDKIKSYLTILGERS